MCFSLLEAVASIIASFVFVLFPCFLWKYAKKRSDWTAQICCWSSRISISWTVSVFKNTNWGNGLRILVALMAQNIQSGPAAVSVYGECIQTLRFARLTFTEAARGADSPPHLSSASRLHARLFMNENINSPLAEVSPKKKKTHRRIASLQIYLSGFPVGSWFCSSCEHCGSIILVLSARLYISRKTGE